MGKPRKPGNKAKPWEWDQYRERMREWEEEKNAAKRAGFIAEAVVTAAFGIAEATTFPEASNFLPGQGGALDEGWAKRTAQVERDRRSRDMEDGTSDSSNRTGWSSQDY